jgi:hypothetical protein
VTVNGEQGASATWSRESKLGSMVCGDRRLALGENPVGILYDLVGGKAAGRASQVHRTAGRTESQSDTPCRLDLGGEHVAAGRREHRVVVHRGRATGEGKRGEAGARGDVFELGVEVRPQGVERGQPLKQRAVGGVAAREPLVEVMVGVDEAGRRQAAACVEAPCAVARRRGPAPTAVIRPPVTTTCPVACSVPAASTVAIAQPSRITVSVPGGEVATA